MTDGAATMNMDGSGVSNGRQEEQQQSQSVEVMSEPAVNGTVADVEMKEEPGQPSEASLLQPQPDPAATPAAASKAGNAMPSTTPSAARSSPHPSQNATPAPPQQPLPHGAPTRVYLNQHVTPHLLEGMKWLAVNEPAAPLKWLSEFLAQKSKEVEGT